MIDENTNYYFAYGMNSDPEQMNLRTGKPTAIGRALVRDHGFRFALHADVFPEVGTTTYGVLWDITPDQLKALDLREGYPYYYDRKIIDVECAGKVYRAWMYYMTPGQREYPPTDGYYQMLVRGYTHFNISLDQIKKALDSSNQTSLKEISVDHYKTMRTNVVYDYGYKNYSEIDYRGQVINKSVRWFNSYEELVKFVAGKRKLREIREEAFKYSMSVEDLCREYVEYDSIWVPGHFQVKNSWISYDSNNCYYQTY